MPVIILEGADESGKTTLAQALTGYLKDTIGQSQIQYLKSPAGRNPEWDSMWNVWVKIQENRAFLYPNEVILMDRTPEISEPVYAFSVGRDNRYQYPIRGWAEWNSRTTTPIFCLPSKSPYTFEVEHRDAFGRDVGSSQVQDVVRSMYKYTAWLIGYMIPNTLIWDRYEDSDIAFPELLHNLAGKYPRFFSLGKRIIPPFTHLVEKGKEIIDGQH